MKILFDIRPQFRSPEIHICCDKRTPELADLQQQLEELLSAGLTVYREQEAVRLHTNEIVRIYSENRRVSARTKTDTFEVRERLYILEELLSGSFVRISNSELVNISKIAKLDMSYAGTIKMYLKNGDITFVSRRYVGKIKEVLK